MSAILHKQMAVFSGDADAAFGLSLHARFLERVSKTVL